MQSTLHLKGHGLKSCAMQKSRAENVLVKALCFYVAFHSASHELA